MMLPAVKCFFAGITWQDWRLSRGRSTCVEEVLMRAPPMKKWSSFIGLLLTFISATR